MTWDLKITGGTIVDGTGAPAYAGDVAISDGRIVAVGKCDGAAREEIDADGALVTPGFVDIHTHYDGQVSWDADLQPSSVHGVTTAVMGSCGVGFAPVREADHARLIELMEGVEDIPGSALAEGLTWDWESFPEYMDAVGSRPHAIDFCAQVTHDPLRVFVMGERAMANEEATETDIAEMRRLLRESLQAGAVGFSTGRTDNHRTVKGEHTPAAEANERELAGLAEAFVGLNHGVLQAVSDFDMFDGKQRFDAEFDLVERMARISGRPTSVSLMQRDQDADQWQRIMARAERATANGTPIHMQVAARAIGVILGLETTFQPFMGFASYKSIAHLPLADRVAAMRNPDFKAQLLTEKSEQLAGDGSPIPPLADMLLAQVDVIAMRMFTLGEVPDYEPSLADSIGVRAKSRGEPVLSALYDALLENEGQALLYFPLYNYTDGNLDNVHTMLSHPLALPGLSDGGAHVGTICDATFPTFLLTHWARDRKRGGFDIEKVVKMQTHDTARFIGMHDRGTLAVGQRADINVIDHANLRLLPPRLVSDLPAGGRRLLQRAEGYVATLVHGQVIARDGYLTGKRPGQLVRLGV